MADKSQMVKDLAVSITVSDGIEDAQAEYEIDKYLYQKDSWWTYSHFRMLHIFVFLCTLSCTTNGYDGSMLNGLQALDSWQDAMGHPEGYKLGSLANGTIFGSVLSVSVAAWLSDKVGRRVAIIIGSGIAVVGAILQGASTNFAFFLVSRILLGFGVGIGAIASPALIAEISYPTFRPTCTTLYNTLWYLGAVIAAWVTFGTQHLKGSASWRVPSYIQAFLPAVQFVSLWWCPESPRWMIAKGREDEARQILFKYHTGGDQDDRAVRLVEFEIKEIKAALEMEKICSNSKYSDFLTIPSYRKRLFLLSFTAIIMQLSGNGLVSYYLSKVLTSIGIKSANEQLIINGCLMIYNMVIALSVAFVVYLFRRRTLFLTSISGMLFSYIIWTALSAVNQQRDFKDKSLGKGVLAMIFFYYLSYDIGANGLPFLYVTEILPYTHRAKGLNVMYGVQMTTLVYNGYVNPIAMDALDWKYYIVWCCFLAFELLIVYFFFVETYGYSLEEVAKVFGDDPNSSLIQSTSSNEKASIEHLEDTSSAEIGRVV